jgi:hypothetical protein
LHRANTRQHFSRTIFFVGAWSIALTKSQLVSRTQENSVVELLGELNGTLTCRRATCCSSMLPPVFPELPAAAAPDPDAPNEPEVRSERAGDRLDGPRRLFRLDSAFDTHRYHSSATVFRCLVHSAPMKYHCLFRMRENSAREIETNGSPY